MLWEICEKQNVRQKGNIMEFKELILKRRSCRAYEESGRIEKAEVEEVLNEALLAPSWCNYESARCYVAVSPEKIEAVRSALPDYNKNNSKNACVYIVTAYEKGASGYIGGKPSDGLGDQWGAYDLGLHDAYLVLSLKDHGYDSLIMGLRDENKLRELFAIPENEVIMSVIAVGTHNGDIKPGPRKALSEVAKIR